MNPTTPQDFHTDSFPHLPSRLGRFNVVMLTFDTLRYDVAEQEFLAGHTPNLAKLLPQGWTKGHAPASFTYAAHCAFFAGFLPTPAQPGPHQRLFALQFAGSETIGQNTLVFDTGDIVAGFAGQGYRTICIGGVGFFKKENPLSCYLPSLFQQSYWQPEFGVTCPESTQHQVALACELLTQTSQPTFLFINISALHQPNCCYLAGSQHDSIASHAAALRYVDSQLGALFDCALQQHDTLFIMSSDHGTCYGEEGYNGHRIAHPHVWTVPYSIVYQEKSLEQ